MRKASLFPIGRDICRRRGLLALLAGCVLGLGCASTAVQPASPESVSAAPPPASSSPSEPEGGLAAEKIEIDPLLSQILGHSLKDARRVLEQAGLRADVGGTP